MLAPESVMVLDPVLVSPPVPLMTPEKLAAPLPPTVRTKDWLSTAPGTVRALLPLLVQLWAVPSRMPGLNVTVPEPGLMVMPALAVLPMVKAKPPALLRFRLLISPPVPMTAMLLRDMLAPKVMAP